MFIHIEFESIEDRIIRELRNRGLANPRKEMGRYYIGGPDGSKEWTARYEVVFSEKPDASLEIHPIGGLTMEFKLERIKQVEEV